MDNKSSKNVKVDLMVDSLIIHTTIASTTYLHQKAQSPRQITGVDIMCTYRWRLAGNRCKIE